MTFPFNTLRQQLEGDLYDDLSYRLMYATDASVYREVPAAVACPAGVDDLKKILSFCKNHQLPLIPRTAGTSLAGQVVGHGLVVDFSRYMNKVIELNTSERWVRVQPGVILDDLNRYLEPYGLFFGPETSTGNRCMIGGMAANNACGSHSLIYGSTRDHTLEINALLSDGNMATFGPLNKQDFRIKCVGSGLENKIYRQLFEMLSNRENQKEITENYPDQRINRRNTGYALDLLLKSAPFGGPEDFNMCRILCGAEGTLAIYCDIRLQLVPLPPPVKALMCVHLSSVHEALKANLVALEHQPTAVELMDKHILDCTKDNLQHAKNRFFIRGNPGAVLLVEFACNTREEAVKQTTKLENRLRQNQLGSHYPVLFENDIGKVWALRKAGLGLLSNIPGDAKPVSVIEDTAVHVEVLPDFISEVTALLDSLGLQCVFHAHIGSGELHLRPLLNLKNRTDIERFYQVAEGMAILVKKYRGSLSGEHGDGRLRGAFIPVVLGEQCHAMLQEVKHTWDPDNLLNPGKIVNTASIKDNFRYIPAPHQKKIKTYFDFEKTLGFIRATEKCNGSGDCRKPHSAGGVMCPSYQATLNEYDSTRGRANLLREMIISTPQKNPFNHKELVNVLDLCLSCKGCKSECPAGVDMGKLKAEVLQHYYDANGTPVRARITGAFATLNKAGSMVPGLFNFFSKNRLTGSIIKKVLGFAQQRSLPLISRQSLAAWTGKNLPALNNAIRTNKKVYLFCDEFTNYGDTQTGIYSCLLLHHLGYRIEIPKHTESGRACLSKGLLKKASAIAKKNIEWLSPSVSDTCRLVGIEPSAILCFRDEYPELVNGETKNQAQNLAKHTYTIEEFIAEEYLAGNIDRSLFDNRQRNILFHTHCHQKALSSAHHLATMLSVPPNNDITEIDCGCCGMAGAFGYEKDHYSLSMQIGELSLFPAIRRAGDDTIIVASGTSCRQQILDGTGRKAIHPAEALYLSLKQS